MDALESMVVIMMQFIFPGKLKDASLTLPSQARGQLMPIPKGLRKKLSRKRFHRALCLISVLAVFAPSHRGLTEFARNSLKLSGLRLWLWQRKVWWGLVASWSISRRLRHPGKALELNRFFINPDWSAVKDHLGHGKGLILLGSHFGPNRAMRHFLMQSGLPVVCVAHDRQLAHIPVGYESDRAESPTILVRLLNTLQEGGIVYATPDGAFFQRSISRPLLKRDFPMSVGLATLARLSGAPTLTSVALWKFHKVGVEFGPRIEPSPGLTREAWNQEYIDQYLRWAEGLLRRDPRNYRLHGRFWFHVAGADSTHRT